MTEILLVRHGQSVWNAQGRWQGQADPPLSALGRRQAEAAAEHLATQEPFDGIATSTLQRATTTASVIADRLGHGPPLAIADLAERSAGEWSGLTRAEIDDRYPGYLGSRRYPPGYEHDDELLTRIKRGLGDVVTKLDGDRLLVVAHGGLVYCIESALGLPFHHLSNLGARWLVVGDDVNLALGPRIDLLVDFAGEHTTPTSI